MCFNSLEGAIVADEMISNDESASFLGQKLFHLNNKNGEKIILGGAGDDEVLRRIDYQLKKVKFNSKTDFCKIIRAALKDVKNEMIKENPDQKWKDDVSYLSIHYDNQELYIHKFSTDNYERESFIADYRCIGSGSTIAEEYLHYFF